MKPIGGEIAFKEENYQSFFTDSGRSSLRLFFRSFDYKNKKVLLPNFFCDIIEQILKEESIAYEFYNVNSNFSINSDEINNKQFDILYVINYFGSITELENINLTHKILLEDNVFSINFSNNHKAKKWYAFNSFRKITSLTDGSLIKTNLPINDSNIVKQQATYVDYKAEASIIKYNFLKNDSGSENGYINLFKKGEQEIDKQNIIYSISSSSLHKLFSIDFEKEKEISEKRFNKLKEVIAFKKIVPEYFTFFTLELNSKNNFINHMRKHQVYLPYFWQKTSQNNEMYNKLVAIPLFSNYSDAEFNLIYKLLFEYINNQS